MITCRERRGDVVVVTKGQRGLVFSVVPELLSLIVGGFSGESGIM